MSDPRIAQLEQQLAALAARNQELEAQVAAIHGQQAAASQARVKAVKTGGKWLIPLLDRSKVVKSFGELAETVGRMTGPREQWPSRDDIVERARLFMESCVRFTVRRRTSFWLFSMMAASIPFMQLWVVVQQNEIISNQNEFFEIQVHDVVSRSMTEGDRNARLMTGALLSRAKLTFLADVVDEAFDPDLSAVYTAQGTKAARRRLEDAAFRGFLMRAVARGVLLRAEDDRDELVETAQPMLRKILVDAADRVPTLMRFGRAGAELDPELTEQANNYLFQLGAVIRTYGRLARSEGLEKEFAEDLEPLLLRVTGLKLQDNRFADPYRFSMDSVLLDASAELKLGDSEIDWESGEQDIEAARKKGIEWLSETLGSKGIDWDAFEQQL